MNWSIPRTVLFALCMLPVASGAQTRNRTWARLSVGRADLRVSCNICNGAEQSSWSADLSAGGHVGTRTKLGGELGFWRRGGEEATQRVIQLSAVSQLYPFEAPAFVKLGLGVLSYSATDGEESLDATSLALQVGAGVEVPVHRGYIVMPHVTLVQAVNGGLSLDGAKVTGWSRMAMLRVGLGVGIGR